MKIELHQNPLKSKIILDEYSGTILRKSIVADIYQSKLVEIAFNFKQNSEISEDLFDLDIKQQVDELFEECKKELEEGQHVGDCIRFACSCMKCVAEEHLNTSTLWDIVDVPFSSLVGYELSVLFKHIDNIHEAVYNAKIVSEETRNWLSAYLNKYQSI